MPLRAATLLLLPFLVCSFAGYAAPATHPAYQLTVQAIFGGPPLDSLASSPVGTTSGFVETLPELLPPAAGPFSLVTIDHTDIEHGPVLLPLLVILILLFGMMAIANDPQYACRKNPPKLDVQ